MNIYIVRTEDQEALYFKSKDAAEQYIAGQIPWLLEEFDTDDEETLRRDIIYMQEVETYD